MIAEGQQIDLIHLFSECDNALLSTSHFQIKYNNKFVDELNFFFVRLIHHRKVTGSKFFSMNPLEKRRK